MILGLTKSRLHAPLQFLTVLLSLVGNSLGHHHRGRSFHMTAHAHLASYLWWYMILQAAGGVFLKMHVWEGTKVRRAVVGMHGLVGKSFPLVGWAQMLLGGIASLGFWCVFSFFPLSSVLSSSFSSLTDCLSLTRSFDNPGGHMGQCIVSLPSLSSASSFPPLLSPSSFFPFLRS
jgi:hypothetical protein